MGAQEIDTDFTDFPKCPHCGAVDQDWWDGQPVRNDGDTWDFECPSCGKDVMVTICIETTFITQVRQNGKACLNCLQQPQGAIPPEQTAPSAAPVVGNNSTRKANYERRSR